MTKVICEAGINHNGDMDMAKQLIDKAKEIEADAIKFQLYKTELLVSKTHQYDWYNTLKSCELSIEQMAELAYYAKQKNIEFLCTPDDLESAEQLNHLVKSFKISSVGAANIHLLRLINKFQKPVILSTGLVNKNGIELALSILKNCEVTLLYCISKYPTDENDISLKHFEGLKDFDTEIGFSDHTVNNKSAMILLQHGATVFEKHFTLDNRLDGPDHHMSQNPHEMKDYIEALKGVKL